MYTVARYLTERLAQLGVSDIFLVPGNYLAEFLSTAGSQFNFIGCNNEMEAAHAADATGRLKGLGVCAVTEGVGLGSCLNAMIGARVEMVPVVTVAGGAKTTAVAELIREGIVYSHGIDPTRNDVHTASAIAEAAAAVTSGQEAPAIIDRILQTCIRKSLPVFLMVREDAWLQECAQPVGDLGLPEAAGTDAVSNVDAAVQAVVSKLRRAKNPIFWAGMELQRRAGMQDQFAELLRITGCPYVTTIVAKSVLDETDSAPSLGQYIGLYDGVFADDNVAAAVHAADLIISLGALRVEDDQTVTQEKWEQTVDVRGETVRVGRSFYHNVPFPAFINHLVQTLSSSRRRKTRTAVESAVIAPRPLSSPCGSDQPITWDAFFDVFEDHFFTPDMHVLADTSVLMIPAANRLRLERNHFITQACWFSIGWTMGATIGVSASLPSSDKVVCIVGDGGFQQQPQAIATLAMIKRPAVILIMDNGYYAIEQLLIEPNFFVDHSQPGLPYNKRPRWDYAALAQSLGAVGRKCTTLAELYEALRIAKNLQGLETPIVISVSLDSRDLPLELRRTIEPKQSTGSGSGHVQLKRMR